MRKKLALNESIIEEKTIKAEDIDAFAKVSGDNNILHMSDDNIFGKRIAHGVLSVCYISKILGMDFPGEGTIYLEQDCKFKKPIFVGDTIYIKISVKEIINKDKGVIRLSNIVTNQKEEVVIEGNSVVKIPKEIEIVES